MHHLTVDIDSQMKRFVDEWDGDAEMIMLGDDTDSLPPVIANELASSLA